MSQLSIFSFFGVSRGGSRKKRVSSFASKFSKMK